ncbi:hypothetical protein SAM_2157 [Streptococcus agalactiae CJB111]|nr:hypothetical protein SAM_2157 [Streptococcus agalactiae CJB111]
MTLIGMLLTPFLWQAKKKSMTNQYSVVYLTTSAIPLLNHGQLAL